MTCDLRGNGLFEWMTKINQPQQDTNKNGRKKWPSPQKDSEKNHLVGRFCQDPGAAADVAGAAAGVCRDAGDVGGEAGLFKDQNWMVGTTT